MLLLAYPWQSLETGSSWSILMCLLTYFYIPALKSSASNLRAWARYFPIKYIFTSSFLSQFPFYGPVSVVQRNWLISWKLRWKKSFRHSRPGVVPKFCQLGNHLHSRACVVSDLNSPPFVGRVPCRFQNKQRWTKLQALVRRKKWAYRFPFLATGIVSLAPFQVIIHSTAFHFKNTIQILRKCRLVGFLTAPMVTAPHSHLSRLA